MVRGTLAPVLDRLRRLVGALPETLSADAALLERFLRDRDQEAFAALVGRHGSMVLGVCRRTTGHDDDAEDAFQATFLVLARQAGSVRRQASLASWLHGVARRLSLRARADAARRREHERQAIRETEADATEVEGRDLARALDEELARLPEKYRQAVVLCDLEGHSHEQAARELGCPAGSMSWRLEKGRDLLRRRLLKRGVTASVTGLAAGTVRAVGPASPRAHALAEGMVKAMVLKRAAVTTAVLAALGLCGAGAGAWLWPARATVPPAPVRAVPAPATKLDRLGDPLPPGAVARMGTLRLWQPEGPAAIFASDDKSVFTAAGLTVRQWDVASGRELRRFTGHAGQLTSVALSLDGRTLAAGDSDGLVLWWETATAKERGRFRREKREIAALAFSPAGNFLVVGGTGPSLECRDLAAGQVVRRFEYPEAEHDHVGSVAFSPDGKWLLTAGSRGVLLFDAATGKKGRENNLYGVRHASFSGDGKKLVVVGGIRPTWGTICDATTLQSLGAIRDRESRIDGAALSPDGTKTAVWGNFALVLTDAPGIVPRRVLGDRQAGVRAVAWSSDGKTLASVGLDSRVRLWDVARGTEKHDFERHTQEPGWLAFSPDGKTLATAGDDYTLRLWETQTGKPLGTLEGHTGRVMCVAFAPDGKTLASCSGDKEDATVRLWDVKTGKELRRFPDGADRGPRFVVFSPDGKTLAASCWNGLLRAWDVASGQEARGVDLPGLWRYHIPSPDLKTVAGARQGGLGRDNPVYLWDTATGKEKRSLSGHTHQVIANAWSADGRRLLSSSWDGTARVWDPATGRLIASLEGHDDRIQAAALSPDGSLAATGMSHERAALLWDARSGKLLRRLEGHDDSVCCLVFSPDGRFLVSGSRDTTALVWELR